ATLSVSDCIQRPSTQNRTGPTKTVKIASVSASSSDLTLVREFPEHPIRDPKSYDEASQTLDRLVLRDDKDLDPGERDYLETLEMLIEAYDQKHFELAPDRRTPAQRLKHLLRQTQMTPTDLRGILGASQSLVSLILRGRRNLTLG